MTEEKDRKERVIHTRVSETLDEEIRRRANGLGVSVSNLIRNALAHTFGLVEDVIADSASVARSARGEGPAAPPRTAAGAPSAASSPAIFGWQVLVLNLNAICTHCNDIMPKGTEAALAVTDPPGARVFVCKRCLQEIRHDSSSTDPRGESGGPAAPPT